MRTTKNFPIKKLYKAINYGGIITMKKYLVYWIDRGASHNGIFYAHNMKELREQTEYLSGHITSIDLLEE